MHVACADPESFFFRRGPILTTFFLDEGIQIPLKANHHWPASETPNIECWFGSFVIFQQIQASTAMKPYIFVIFRGVSGPLSQPLDPPMC